MRPINSKKKIIKSLITIVSIFIGFHLFGFAQVQWPNIQINNNTAYIIESDYITTLQQNIQGFNLTNERPNNNKILVIPLLYENSETPTITEQQIHNLIFDGTLKNFYEEQSYGKLQIEGDILDYVNLPFERIEGLDCKEYYREAGIIRQISDPDPRPHIEQKVLEQDITRGNYDHIILLDEGCINPTQEVNYRKGIASLGAVSVQVNNQYHEQSIGWVESLFNNSSSLGNDRTLAHEFGHLLGVGHANRIYKDCSGGTCTETIHEYGNNYDIMGGGATYVLSKRGWHKNGYFKKLAGFIEESDILYITQGGEYTIGNLETDTDHKKYSEIHYDNKKYTLEYRRPIGFDSDVNGNPNVENGLLINLVDEGYVYHNIDETYLINVGGEEGLTDTNDSLYGDNIFELSDGVYIGPITSNNHESITFNVTIGCEEGMQCNDNNTCTTNDIINQNCRCTGTRTDSDGDSVCDGEDLCQGHDDSQDNDGDGEPDGCDPHDDTLCDEDNLPDLRTSKIEFKTEYSELNYCKNNHNNFNQLYEMNYTISVFESGFDTLIYEDTMDFKLLGYNSLEYDNPNNNCRSQPLDYAEEAFSNIEQILNNDGSAILKIERNKPQKEELEECNYENNTRTIKICGIDEFGDYIIDQACDQLPTECSELGQSCNDQDACTENDIINENCECVGNPLPDSDNDGTCDTQDNDDDGDGIDDVDEIEGCELLSDCDGDDIGDRADICPDNAGENDNFGCPYPDIAIGNSTIENYNDTQTLLIQLCKNNEFDILSGNIIESVVSTGTNDEIYSFNTGDYNDLDKDQCLTIEIELNQPGIEEVSIDINPENINGDNQYMQLAEQIYTNNTKTLSLCEENGSYTIGTPDCPEPDNDQESCITDQNQDGQCDIFEPHTRELSGSELLLNTGDINITGLNNCQTVNINPNQLTCDMLGITTVNIITTNSEYQSYTCSTTGTVKDIEPPQITCQEDVTINPSPDQPFVINETTILSGTDENCQIQSYSIIENTTSIGNIEWGSEITCNDINENTENGSITILATDDSGLTGTCTTEVLFDNTNCEVECTSNVECNQNDICVSNNCYPPEHPCIDSGGDSDQDTICDDDEANGAEDDPCDPNTSSHLCCQQNGHGGNQDEDALCDDQEIAGCENTSDCDNDGILDHIDSCPIEYEPDGGCLDAGLLCQ